MRIETRSLKQNSAHIAQHSVLCAALCAMLFALCSVAEAQQQKKIARIGFLAINSGSSSATSVDAFRLGLRQLGYIEGQNIIIEWRYADGRSDRLPDLAAELVRLKVDVIVTSATSPTQAAKKATNTIPIVIASHNDPIGAGLVTSLARPGGNVTGVSTLTSTLEPKRLTLVRELAPQTYIFGVLLNPNNPPAAIQLSK